MVHPIQQADSTPSVSQRLPLPLPLPLPVESADEMADDLALKTLRLITCGSVDDGKSTLIGRLLWDTKSVPVDHADTLPSSPVHDEDGAYLPEFALLLDGLQAEREQGITIDVAYRYFSSEKRSFIIADTPGHEQYTRNMATGCSTADLAIVLVDAQAGLLEQTRRHTTIAALMGVRQIVLVVNKMDKVNFDQGVFRAITDQFRLLTDQLQITEITSIPVSALHGYNVVNANRVDMGWYRGPSLLQAIRHAPVKDHLNSGFRLSVQGVCRPDSSFRGYQGTIVGGPISCGQPVTILP